MSREPKFLSHAQRARRKYAVIADFRAGLVAPEIAARRGLSPCYCSEIARAAGVKQRSRGRPRQSEA